MSIYEKVTESMDEIHKAFVKNIVAPGESLEKVRENLVQEGWVHTYDGESSGTDGWLAAIDGANAMEQMSTGDLILVGSSVGEGQAREHYFNDETLPNELWHAIIPHVNGNTDIMNAVRAAQEIRLFERINPERLNAEGIRIVDGAWLGNASSVLYAFLNSKTAETIIKLNKYDADKLLLDGLMSFVRPDSTNPANSLALVKSDSDTVYVNKWSSNAEGMFIMDDREGYTDRFVTSYVLQPGEFISPRSVRYNEHLWRQLNDSEARLEDILIAARNRKSLAKALHELKDEMRALNDERKLWATYFKPSEFNMNDKALKIEFPFCPNGLEGAELEEAVTAHARQLIETVNSDMSGNGLLEPWCQYNVDVHAKQVSAGMRLIKAHLVSVVDEQVARRNLLRGFRT